MNCSAAADDLTRFRVAAATMSLMGQNIADMLRRNNVNVVENSNDDKVNIFREPEKILNNEEAVNGDANGDDEEEEEEDGVNDAQEVGHDEGRSHREIERNDARVQWKSDLKLQIVAEEKDFLCRLNYQKLLLSWGTLGS